MRDDGWDGESSQIELHEEFCEATLRGLDAFSHVIVVYVLDQVDGTWVDYRHPRGNPEWPDVGIFAQRAKDRPNPLGVSVARLVAVQGRRLVLEGLDALDGTPVLDIKPWMVEFGPRGELTQPAWSTDLMTNYWSS